MAKSHKAFIYREKLEVPTGLMEKLRGAEVTKAWSL